MTNSFCVISFLYCPQFIFSFSIYFSFLIALPEDPEFTDVIENITVPAGRNIKLACSVKNLGSYKVTFIIIIDASKVSSVLFGNCYTIHYEFMKKVNDDMTQNDKLQPMYIISDVICHWKLMLKISLNKLLHYKLDIFFHRSTKTFLFVDFWFSTIFIVIELLRLGLESWFDFCLLFFEDKIWKHLQSFNFLWKKGFAFIQH